MEPRGVLLKDTDFASGTENGNFLVYKAILPCEAVVGAGLTLDHYGLGIVIHPNVTIGDRVRIYHGVTLAAETGLGRSIASLSATMS